MVESSTERDLRPDTASAGCWVRVWEDTEFHDNSLVIWGPAQYPNMRDLPGANGYDWGDQIGSLMTGASCWVQLFADENYSDTDYWMGPNSSIGDLGDMEDEVDSIRIFDHPPTRFFEWISEHHPFRNVKGRIRSRARREHARAHLRWNKRQAVVRSATLISSADRRADFSARSGAFIWFQAYTYRTGTIQTAEVTASVRLAANPEQKYGVEVLRDQIVEPVVGEEVNGRRVYEVTCRANWPIETDSDEAMRDFTVRALASSQGIGDLEGTAVFKMSEMH